MSHTMDTTAIELIPHYNQHGNRDRDDIQVGGKYIGTVYHETAAGSNLVNIIVPLIETSGVVVPDRFLNVYVPHEEMLDQIKAIVSLLPPL